MSKIQSLAKNNEETKDTQYSPENIEFIAQELQSPEPDFQIHALDYFAKGFERGAEMSETILLTCENIIHCIIGYAMQPQNEAIQNYAFLCLDILTSQNVSTDVIVEARGLDECLLAHMREGCECIQNIINIMCILLEDWDVRERMFAQGIVEVVAQIPVEIDTSKLVVIIFKYSEFNEGLAPFLELIASWFTCDDPNRICSALTIYSGLIVQMREAPAIGEAISVEDIHARALELAVCDNDQLIGNSFLLLDAIHAIQEEDIATCIACFETSDRCAILACHYLEKLHEQWEEAKATDVAVAIVENVSSRNFTAKRLMLEILAKHCLRYMTSFSEEITAVFFDVIEDKLLGKLAIEAVSFVAQSLSGTTGNDWFVSQLEENVDAIESYTMSSNECVAENANLLLEALASLE